MLAAAAAIALPAAPSAQSYAPPYLIFQDSGPSEGRVREIAKCEAYRTIASEAEASYAEALKRASEGGGAEAARAALQRRARTASERDAACRPQPQPDPADVSWIATWVIGTMSVLLGLALIGARWENRRRSP